MKKLQISRKVMMMMVLIEEVKIDDDIEELKKEVDQKMELRRGS